MPRLILGWSLLAACGAPPPEPALYGTWAVTWDRSATGWSPPYFHGTLELGPDTAGLVFTESAATFTVREVALGADPDALVLWFDVADGTEVRLDLRPDDDRLGGTLEWTGSIPRSPLRGKRLTPSPRPPTGPAESITPIVAVRSSHPAP